MEQSYIVQLYIRRLFRWKMHDFYPYRAYALEAGRALKSVGINIKLIQDIFIVATQDLSGIQFYLPIQGSR